MARFVFELEAVLKQRAAEERTKQLAVAEIEFRRLGIEQEIRAYQERIMSEREELRDHLRTERRDGDEGPGVDMAVVRRQASTALDLVARAQQAVLRLAGVHKQLDAARLELLQATTRRKAVESLKDKRFEEWKAEQGRKENAALDEWVVMRAARTDREEAA